MENIDDHGLVLIRGDVLIQILVWLPVISMLRFKSVCKSWRAIFESSFFIHLHATLTTTTTTTSSNKFGTFIIQTSPVSYQTETRIFMLTPSRRSGGGDEVFEVEDLGFPPLYKSDPARWKIVGCCNGLICTKLGKDVSLWNPATRQFRLLPKSSLTMEEEKDESGWIFYPDVFGFGFDVKTKDYKVVQIRPKSYGKKEFRVQVYSLSTNSWRFLEEQGERDINSLYAKSCQGPLDMYSDGLYLNGSFFFKGTDWIEKRKRYWIVSFDFTKEIFTPIKLMFPDEQQLDSNSTLILTYFGADKIKIAFLVESSSFSYSSSREEGRTNVVYDIWVLNNNNEHDDDQEKKEEDEEESYYWTKLQHSIRTSTGDSSLIFPRAISDDGKFALIVTRGDDWNLGLTNDDDGEFAMIETRGGDNGAKDLKLQLFNLVTKEGKTFFVFPTGMELLRADIYKPTLVSVIGGGGGGNGNGTAGSSS